MLCIAIAANAFASILLKKSSMKMSYPLLKLATLEISPYFLLSAGLFIVAFVSYAISLRDLPLHLAHPLSTAIPITLVSFFSWVLLGEKFSYTSFLGLGLILLGVLFLSKG